MYRLYDDIDQQYFEYLEHQLEYKRYLEEEYEEYLKEEYKLYLRDGLSAEIGELQELLTTTPKENIIEHKSIQARLETVEAKLKDVS